MKYLYYHGPITEAGARNIETLLLDSLHDGSGEVTLCISSYGGDVNAGVGLFNFIRMLPINVNTHAAGLCESIAATILLAGSRRTASGLSLFSTHEAKYTEGPFKGQRAPNTDLISAPFKSVLGWSDAEIAERFGADDFRFSPAVALKLGVIEEIREPKLGPDDRTLVVNV